MSVMCKGCVFFNEDKKSDEKHGHYCSKHDDYVLANEYTCDDYKPKLSPLLKAALFPAFLSSVSDYMGEIEDGGADNGELIDKERAYTALKHEQYTHGLSFSAEVFEKAARIIDQMPTIEAEPVNRWIPVEDALPEIGYSVLVTRQTESNTRYIRIASRQDDCWMDNTDKYGKPNPHRVIAWMQIPDAYKPPEKE